MKKHVVKYIIEIVVDADDTDHAEERAECMMSGLDLPAQFQESDMSARLIFDTSHVAMMFRGEWL